MSTTGDDGLAAMEIELSGSNQTGTLGLLNSPSGGSSEFPGQTGIHCFADKIRNVWNEAELSACPAGQLPAESCNP
jgi:hypothetical protein